MHAAIFKRSWVGSQDSNFHLRDSLYLRLALAYYRESKGGTQNITQIWVWSNGDFTPLSGVTTVSDLSTASRPNSIVAVVRSGMEKSSVAPKFEIRTHYMLLKLLNFMLCTQCPQFFF